MSKYILAIHAGHNASAVIGDRNGIAFAIQEERLTREKNYWGFPRLSIGACLEHVGATAKDLAVIVYGGKQVISRYHSREDVLKAYQRQNTVAGKLRQRVAMPLVLALAPEYGQRTLKGHLEDVGLAQVPNVHFDHHLTHALTAYYGLRANPDEQYLVLTCDGAGDNQCASVRVCGRGDVQDISTTHWDNSLGALYSWTTFAMGFVPLEHEYKLMGMAPYAKAQYADKAADIFRNYLGLSDDGLGFKRKTVQRTNDLGERLFEDIKGQRFDSLCAGLQLFTEELLVDWVKSAVKKTGIRKVLAAGGVFMNVKANKRIGELEEVESFEAFPSCGDETLPFGAFWIEAARRYGEDAAKPLHHLYLGADLDDAETEAAVKASGFNYSKPESMATEVAELLASGQPVARCAGRMEFGARALGNRSILADPANPDVVRVINQMVKKRDFWMPFAPIIKDTRQGEYLDNPKGLASPYMMMTFKTKDNFRDFTAAVHNADLTCRAQILRKSQNESMYELLEAFEAKTDRGVLLNTSFNLHGFPIVRDAKDALHVLRNSGLEYLITGNYLVSKR